MNESDEFRQQVEELKQRLGNTQVQHESQASVLTDRLTSIKASLRQKQEEINRLSAENQQLRIMLDEVIALLNTREDMSSGQMLNGFFDEIAEFIDGEENQAIPNIDISSPPEPSAWEREETPAEPEAAVNLPLEPSAATEIKADTPPAPEEKAEAAPREPKIELSPEPAPEPKQEAEKAEEQEEVPALKRILKRGQRGR